MLIERNLAFILKCAPFFWGGELLALFKPLEYSRWLPCLNPFSGRDSKHLITVSDQPEYLSLQPPILTAYMTYFINSNLA